MPDYPRLPDPPAPDVDSSRESYGLTLLAWIIRERCPVTCTDEQLALALHVAPIASAVRVTVDANKRRSVDYRIEAADAVADAKRLILELQRMRARLAELTPAPTIAPEAPTVDGGSRVPRQPIAPQLPPAPSYADRRAPEVAF